MFALAGCGKNKDELYREGVSLLKSGNPSGAVVLFKNALEKDQNFQDARFQLAAAYQAIGKYEQAEKELLKLQKQNPSRADIPLELAKLYNALGKPDKAIEQANAFLRLHPESVEALEVLGVSYALKGMVNEAEQTLNQALQREPGRISAKLQLAALLLEQKNSRDKEGRALVDDVLRADPKNLKAYNLLAAYEISQGNRERALELYRTISSLSPTDPLPLYRQGIIYLESGSPDKAGEVAATLLKQFPKHSEGYRLKGLVAYHRQNYPEAITALQNANKMFPSLEGLYYLGLSMYNHGELESALSQLRRILDAKPSFAQARMLTAVILLKQKRVDDAIAEAQRVIEADGRNALAHNILGSAYMAKGMYDEGARELNRATQLDPRIIDAHLKIGLFNLSQGRVREAESDFTTAVKVAPDLLDSRLVLAFYYLRQNRSDKALATLKQGLTGRKEDAPLYNTMAAIVFGERKSAEGMQYLQKAKAVNPAFLPARFNLATSYAASGDMDRAMGEYREILQANPRNVKALVGMAALSELKGRDGDALGWYTKAKETGEYGGYLALAAYNEKRGSHDKAIGVLDEAIEAQPRQADAFVMKGRILVAQKKGAEAIKTFTDLESLNPELGLSLKVATYVQLRDSAKALDEARRAVTLKPNAAAGYLLVASVYASRGDLSRAIQEARSGLRAEPANIGAAMQLGDYLARSGNSSAAMDEYGKVLRAKPDYAPAYFAQGMLLETQGKKKEAVARYRRSLEKAETYVPALNNLAFLYADGYGPRQEALRLAMTALKLEPNNAAIVDTYGYALLRSGRAKDAVKVLDRAVALLPNNPSVRYHLALACRESGDRSRAAAAFQQALKQGEFPESAQARKMLAELSLGGGAVKRGKN